MTPDVSPQKSLSEETDVTVPAVIAEQRELALACFILSATLSIAVLWSNLGAEPAGIGETREAVAVHRQLLHQHQVLLADNQKVLSEVEAVRDALLKARVRH
jgi:hypothetical protein